MSFKSGYQTPSAVVTAVLPRPPATIGVKAAIDSLLPSARNSNLPLVRLGTHAVEYRWAKARRAANIKGLRFHDLRHEGLSRMADRGLTIGELQSQSGQRTAQILLSYVNARLSDVSRKLG